MRAPCEDCSFGRHRAHDARPVHELRNRLSHVLWIGGGPCVGKTTLSRLLAGKFDLKIYNIDWHHDREHQLRGMPDGWAALSMDDRWLLPTPEGLAQREIASWTARFRLVTEDLLALPNRRPIIAEGPSAFPWSVAEVIRSSSQAISSCQVRSFATLSCCRVTATLQVGARP